MSRERIAVGLDDVVVATAQPILDHHNSMWGTSLNLGHFYTPDFWMVSGAPDPQTSIQRVNSYLETAAYFDLAPTAESAAAIRQLRETYDLFIVTGRPDSAERATKRWLGQHLPGMFSDVILTNYYDHGKRRDKVEICKQLGASALIDDHEKHLERTAANGIAGILFGEYPWNTEVEVPAGVIRAKNWVAVLEYFDGRR